MYCYCASELTPWQYLPSTKYTVVHDRVWWLSHDMTRCKSSKGLMLMNTLLLTIFLMLSRLWTIFFIILHVSSVLMFAHVFPSFPYKMLQGCLSDVYGDSGVFLFGGRLIGLWRLVIRHWGLLCSLEPLERAEHLPRKCSRRLSPTKRQALNPTFPS